MLINRKVDYALRVLTHLAAEKGKVSTAELSQRLKVPRVFLAKILNELTRCGIITSEKGRYGGVELKDPRTSLKTVIFLFDPSIAFNKCLKKKNRCFLDRQCAMHKFLEKAQNELFSRLDAVTIESIARKGMN